MCPAFQTMSATAATAATAIIARHSYPCKCICADYETFLVTYGAFDYNEEYQFIDLLCKNRIWDEAIVTAKGLIKSLKQLYRFMINPQRINRNQQENISNLNMKILQLSQMVDDLKEYLRRKEEEEENERSIRSMIYLRKKKKHEEAQAQAQVQVKAESQEQIHH